MSISLVRVHVSASECVCGLSVWRKRWLKFLLFKYLAGAGVACRSLSLSWSQRKELKISGEFYHRTCLCLIGIHQANPIKSILSQHEIHIFPRRSVPRIYTVLQYTRDTRTHGSRSIPSDVIKIKSPWKLIAQRNFRNPSASFCCCSLEKL